MPLLVMKKRMKNMGRIEQKVRKTIIILNDLSYEILLLTEDSFILFFYAHPPDNQLTDKVYDGGDDEEHKAQFN